jgi:hypothetical protein
MFSMLVPRLKFQLGLNTSSIGHINALSKNSILKETKMTFDTQRLRVSTGETLGNPQTENFGITFPTSVLKAESVISGFDIGYTRDDHELLRAQVDATVTSIAGNTVFGVVSFLLRDNSTTSGQIDDPYNGFVDVTVIVDRV